MISLPEPQRLFMLEQQLYQNIINGFSMFVHTRMESRGGGVGGDGALWYLGGGGAHTFVIKIKKYP